MSNKTSVTFNKLVEGTEIPQDSTIHGLEWVEGGLEIEWTYE
jgi:hypothetical protein